MPTVGEEQKKPPILELGDVRLRPLRTSDAPALLAYLSDPRVIEHTSIPIATPESVAAAVARDMAAYREGSSFRLALASSDDRVIGICGFNTWSSVAPSRGACIRTCSGLLGPWLHAGSNRRSSRLGFCPAVGLTRFSGL